MPKVSANGIHIHYEQCGCGPDVVMVHGGAASLAFWYLRVVPLLAREYRITVYDLRGHGLSTIAPSGYTTRDLAADLLHLLDRLDLDNVHLAGHSLGGAISLHFTALHPQRVRSLALVDARLHTLQPLRDPKDTAYWEQQRHQLRAKGIVVPDNTPRVAYKMLDELARQDPGLLVSNGVWDPKSRAAKRWHKLVTTTTFAAELRSNSGLTEELIRTVRHPTLLSYDSDSHCLESCRRLEAALANHKTVIHPGVGHFFPLVAPHLMADDLRAFLSEVSRVDQALAGASRDRAVDQSEGVLESGARRPLRPKVTGRRRQDADGRVKG